MEYDKYLSGLQSLKNPSCSFNVREARLDDAFLVSLVVNTAFVEGDAWFKKPEYHLRFDTAGKRMTQLIEQENSKILVAETADDSKQLVGAVLLDWKDTVGHWGALSCPRKYAGRGVGSKLVQAAIEFFQSIESIERIEIPVLSTKNERLIAWYEKRHGLKPIEGEYDFVAPNIVLDEHKGKIKMISMERSV